MSSKQRYVAYTDLGKGSGAPVNPDDHGGEDSAEFKYLLERRVVVPAGDPDAPPLPPEFEVKETKQSAAEEPKATTEDKSKTSTSAKPSGPPLSPSGKSGQ